MKRLLTTILISFIVATSFAQSFTAGNIAVLRIGDSITALANTGNTLALDQFTTSGAYVNSVILPKSGTNAVILGATATSEGFSTLASNGSAITFLAYKTTAPYSAAINTSTSALVNRVVVSVNASGTVSFPSLTATSFSAGNPRCVVSNGTSYWGAGSNTGICWGNSTSNLDTIVSNSSTNIRAMNIFGGQLYYSTASGTTGIWRAGTGTPSNSGTTSSVYFATASGTSPSPYGFALNNDSNICYIADDRVIASGGGIQKWKRTAGVWSLLYTIGTGSGSTVGARAITVNWNTSPATIFAVTAEGSLNRVIRINDTSATVTPVTIATASTNTIFRGVSYTPGTSTLPVNFTSFNAIKQNTDALLTWSTASEINNNGFAIEKSLDGKTFNQIGFVKGAANSNKLLSYNFTDNDLSKGTSYYRLKQIDMDGNYTFSKTVTVVNEVAKKATRTLPNPFNNELNIHVTADAATTATVEVMDMLGKVHYSGIETLTAGDNKININTSNLTDGIYFVRMNINGELFTQKIIKK